MQCKQGGGKTPACFVSHADDDLRAACLHHSGAILDSSVISQLLFPEESGT